MAVVGAWLLGGLLGVARAAPACVDEHEWTPFTITSVSAPQAIPAAGGHVLRQTLEGFADALPDVPLTVHVCDPGLAALMDDPPDIVTPCAAAGHLETHASWARTVWPQLDPERDGAWVPATHPARTQVVWGRLEATGSGRARLYAKRVQAAPPTCGQRIRPGPRYLPDVLLDNLGVGLTTRDDPQDPFGTWRWYRGRTNPTPLLGTFPPQSRDAYVVGPDEGRWRAHTPGFMLPIDGPDADADVLDGDVFLGTSPTSSAAFWQDDDGTLVPSRVARGQVLWDWLWHGQCTVDGAPRWCLPDAHPRHAVFDEPLLVPASACDAVAGVPTCHMACPGGPAPAHQQVRYDLAVLTRFVADAYGPPDAPAIPPPITDPSAPPVRLSQRAALNIAPFGEAPTPLARTDGDFRTATIPADGLVEDWSGALSPPAWLWTPASQGGCGAPHVTGTIVAGDDADADLDPEVYTWRWVEPAEPTYRAQVAHLVQALVGDDHLAPGLPPTPGHTTFQGFDADPRVFSIDVGLVGVGNEWNLQAGVDDLATPDFESFRIEADLAFATGWLPECVLDGVLPPTKVVQDDAWWAELIDVWTAAFPADADGRPVRPDGAGGVHLVGKFEYPAYFPLPDAGDARTCYVPGPYAAGRRGTMPAYRWDGDRADYPGRRLGLRYNAWGQRELTSYDSPALRDDPGLDPTRHVLDSRAWEVGSYQAEVWNTLPELASVARRPALPDLEPVAPYGIWDLDETVRGSVARHLALFDLKTAPFPATDSFVDPDSRTVATPPPLQQLGSPGGPAAGFCDCAVEGRGGPCLALAVHRLLASTGYRVRLVARSYRSPLDAGTLFPVTLRLANEGNVPPYGTWGLEVAFVDRAAFDVRDDPADPDPEFAVAASFPRPTRAPADGRPLAELLVGRRTYCRSDRPLAPGCDGYGVFDARALLPRDGIDPPVGAVYADADLDGDGRIGADEACAAQARGSLGSVVDGALRLPHDWGGPSRAPVVEARLLVAAPTRPGRWVMLYRLADLSTPDAAKRVPMDLPAPRPVGDDTEHRWSFLGYLTTEAP